MIVDNEKEYWTDGNMDGFILRNNAMKKLLSQEDYDEVSKALGDDISENDRLMILLDKNSVESYHSLMSEDYDNDDFDCFKGEQEYYQHYDNYINQLKSNLEKDNLKLYKLSETSYAFVNKELTEGEIEIKK